MIQLQQLCKTYHLKGGDVTALRDVSLNIADGSIYGVIGYSGAGKSTLVRCLNLLEVPDSGAMTLGDSGEITFQGGRAFLDGAAMSSRQQSALRRGIGMIFQHFNLLERSTVFDNIAYPLRYTGRSRRQIEDRVWELLELVGLRDKVDVYPSQLSGGQKQRVAIARALAANPRILMSDEATSALDPDATESIPNLLGELNRKLGITIVMITHEMAVIKAVADRVAVMEDGRVVEEGSVYDIFAAPKANITRKFIASASPLGKIDRLIAEGSELVRVQPGELLVKLIFQKDCVSEHVLTTAARRYGFDLNVVLANVEYLHGNPLGGMIGILSGGKKEIEDGMASLAKNHVSTEVIRDGRVD